MMTPAERRAEIERLQAERDHCAKRIGQCIILAAVVLIGGMWAVVIMAMLGV